MTFHEIIQAILKLPDCALDMKHIWMDSTHHCARLALDRISAMKAKGIDLSRSHDAAHTKETLLEALRTMEEGDGSKIFPSGHKRVRLFFTNPI